METGEIHEPKRHSLGSTAAMMVSKKLADMLMSILMGWSCFMRFGTPFFGIMICFDLEVLDSDTWA